MARKKRRLRTDLRKNRGDRARDKGHARRHSGDPDQFVDAPKSERISGKGSLTRKRTVVDAEVTEDASGTVVRPAVDKSICQLGRVMRVQGLVSLVRSEQDHRLIRCATRRLLKTLSTDQRHVVAAGDRVWFRPEGDEEGIIERVEPRHGLLSRTSRGRQHILVANVDQIVMVASAEEPRLKPNLVDRILVTAERNEIEPLICINKIDLAPGGLLEPEIGVWAQLGYRVIRTSAITRQGIDELRECLHERASVFFGQSGVGKSSLLNAIDPDLQLRVQQVSRETQKGKHTTTTANLIAYGEIGFVVDTPGIRQFELWDVIPEEVAGFFRDIRPFVSQCRFPDCSHDHEVACAVRAAVDRGFIDPRRNESYLQIYHGDAQ